MWLSSGNSELEIMVRVDQSSDISIEKSKRLIVEENRCKNRQTIQEAEPIKFINMVVCANFIKYLSSGLISWYSPNLILNHYFIIESSTGYAGIIKVYAVYDILPVALLCQFLISNDRQTFSLLVGDNIFKLWTVIIHKDVTNVPISIAICVIESILVILNFIAFISSDCQA